MKKFKLLFLLIIAGVLSLNAQWVPVGSGQLPGYIEDHDMAIHPQTGEPYIVFNADADNNKLSVMRFNGSQWVYVGSPAFTLAEGTDVEIEITETGWIYIAFRDFYFNGKASVMYKAPYSSSWYYYGAGFTSNSSQNLSFKASGSSQPTLYLAYEDNNNGVSVMHNSNSTGNNWQLLGNANIGGTIYSYEPSLTTINDDVVVAFEIAQNVFVKSIDLNNIGNGWGTLHSIANSALPQLTLDPSINRLSVAFTEDKGNNVLYLSAQKYTGSNWVYIGSSGLNFPTSIEGYPIAFKYHPITSDPYILYQDYKTYSGTISLLKFNGSSWNYVGTPGNFDSPIASLDFHNQTYTPYVSHSDGISQEVEYFDDGCSRTLTSILENIYNPNSGANSYQFSVYDITNQVTYTVGGYNNNNYMKITQVPNWAYSRTYQIRSRAYYNMFGWTSWTDYCYITTPDDPNPPGPFKKGTSKENSLSSSLLKIYPNPSSDILNINLGAEPDHSEFNLEIYNSAGQGVRSITRSSFDANGEATMDLSLLPTGIYLLRGIANGQLINETIIRE